MHLRRGACLKIISEDALEEGSVSEKSSAKTHLRRGACLEIISEDALEEGSVSEKSLTKMHLESLGMVVFCKRF